MLRNFLNSNNSAPNIVLHFNLVDPFKFFVENGNFFKKRAFRARGRDTGKVKKYL